MVRINSHKLICVLICAFILLFAGALISHPEPDVLAAPGAALDLAEMSTLDLNCLFTPDCSVPNSTVVSTFTMSGASGSGFLKSYKPVVGQVEMLGAGLYGYRYQIDLTAMISADHCLSQVDFDFGPVVPLDYDGDGELEHVYVITDSVTGGGAPSSAEQLDNTVRFSFTDVCAGESADEGDRSLVFGLASPFKSQEATAEVTDNFVSHYDLETLLPKYSSDVAIKVIPSSGPAGTAVRLVGSGYTPGGYEGTIRWDGEDQNTFDIPSGGAFSLPYNVPASTTAMTHTLAVCAFCDQGEFEQIANVIFEVTADEQDAFELYLPYISRTGGQPIPEPFSYVIDPSVTPSQEELPGLDGTTPRPLAAVRSPEGTVTTFVSNEILVQTDDESTLDALLDRTGGEILIEIDPSEAGITDTAKMYLVRVDLLQADLSDFTEDVTTLMDDEIQTVGEFAYSSQDGVDVFAMAAGEAAGGLTVAINWVSETTEIPDDSLEAANGPTLGGIAYDSDAYNWMHFAQGTVQDIGVPEAWNLLNASGRLSNRVDIAILDQGFAPNADIPAGTTYISVAPFLTDPRNVEGTGHSRWHGTDVLQTAMAVSDNDYGVVGVAAPVGRPIAIFTSYDYVMSIVAVLRARSEGADIVSMSYGADVPTIFAWTVLPFDATTRAVRNSGVLLFASAGNDGNSVDAERCFLGICWERSWITPCENSGVICVGGLGWNSQSRHGNSNWGPESVDIFAPYAVYGGWAPDNTGGDTTVDDIYGTSFSSPYAAGVAALIWAGDPSLSASEVWSIMWDTAHESPDSRVNRYVNAYDGVLQAVGVGVSADLISPIDGYTYNLNTSVGFTARVNYVASEAGIPLNIEWRSNRDGVLQTSTRSPGLGDHMIYNSFTKADLSAGTHTITLNVSAGTASDSASVEITVVNTPPSDVEITNPANGDDFCQGDLVLFRGDAYDINQQMGLPDSAFGWRSSRDGSLGTGRTHTTDSLSVGGHTITLRVTDDGGLYTEDAISIAVISASDPACSDRDPTAAITSPPDQSIYYVNGEDTTGFYYTVIFEGEVDDYETPIGDLTVEWESNETINILSQNVNSSGHATMTARVYLNSEEYSTWHTITLRVTDGDSNVTEDTIDVLVTTMY